MHRYAYPLAVLILWGNNQTAAATLKASAAAAAAPQDANDNYMRSLLLPDISPTSLSNMIHDMERDGHSNNGRVLEDEGKKEECLITYLQCALNQACMNCMGALEEEDVDWITTSGAKDASCDSVLPYITGLQQCKSFSSDAEAKDGFCNVYEACSVYDKMMEYVDDYEEMMLMDDDARYMDDNDDFIVKVDCDTLTECKWEGMRPALIGNSMCNRESCYNTAICGFDGGDCCEDTCTNTTYSECGTDGYACKDPSSTLCSTKLSKECSVEPTVAPPSDKVKCNEDEKLYQLWMYDSWGDGWDDQKLEIYNTTNGEASEANLVNSYWLGNGYKDHKLMCLRDGCYSASIGESEWSDDISWEVMMRTTTIASGRAPAECNFSVGGQYCENTCISSNEEKKEMSDEERNCAEAKCPIQFGSCSTDTESCGKCLDDSSLSFCTSNDKFISLSSCMQCSCSSSENDPKCQTNRDDDNLKCSAQQTLQGMKSLSMYSECSKIDDELALVKEWDENQFGKLDQFEECAHNFAKSKAGSAMACMSILASIVRTNEQSEDNPAILSIAQQLYSDPESLCECTSSTNKMCPDCTKFLKFKTLLHETLDACNAVDEVDCDSWEEFSSPCQNNLRAKFGSIDFSQAQQCAFVKESDCGGAGTFPVFRRLDCDGEISEEAWNFFMYFNEGCKSGNENSPIVTPTTSKPTPVSQPAVVTKSPVKKYIPLPSDDDDKSKGKNSGNKNNSNSSGKSGHGTAVFWSIVLLSLSGGFFLYRKRQRNFYAYPSYPSRTPYHKASSQDNSNMAGGTDLFSGLSVNANSMASTSYEPVRIPGGDTL